MSYKTDRLIDLWPDAYAAHDRESLLYKLLDAIGAELMQVDEAIKQLLKTHWVNYASGPGLDGLAATFDVERRRVQDGQLESDEAFRQRLKAVVPLFTGGGTKQAVIGAVRSALGLPFDLAQLQLPPGFEALRRDIEQLIFIQEFSPTGERVIGRDLAVVNGAHEIVLAIDIPSVGGERPTIRWKMLLGGARGLEIIVQPDDPTLPTTGIRAAETLIIPAGETLVLTALNGGVLSAVVGFQELATQFTNLDGTIPALLPEVPIGRSEWTFRAQGGVFDVSPLDDFTTFDLPTFEIELSGCAMSP
jgi:hypothetical protein